MNHFGKIMIKVFFTFLQPKSAAKTDREPFDVKFNRGLTDTLEAEKLSRSAIM
jgi:hypothetical protein